MITLSKPLPPSLVSRYYSKDKGQWFGAGALHLGLTGETTEEALTLLAQGFSPEGERLVQESRKSDVLTRRAAFDVVATPPKSISIAALVFEDKQVLAAHTEAATKAFQFLEASAIQIRTGGKRELTHRTQNLVGARFQHYTNREQEPNLHDHLVIFNLTFATEREGWRAIEPSRLYQLQNQATALYRAELTALLKQAGYAVRLEQDKEGRGMIPVLEGIPSALCNAFSTRARTIEDDLAKAKSKDAAIAALLRLQAKEAMDPERAAELENRARTFERWTEKREAAYRQGIATKGKKAKRDLPIDELQHLWRKTSEVLLGEGLNSSKTVLLRERSPLESASKVIEAVDNAIEHLTERESLFTYEALIGEVLKPSPYFGRIQKEELDREIELRVRRGELVKGLTAEGGVRYATKTQVDTERDMLSSLRRYASAFRPVGPYDTRLNWAAKEASGIHLNEGQRKAFLDLTGSFSWISLVVGKAGVGKTTLFRHAGAYFEQNDYEVRFFAPTTAAVGELKALGLNAATLQSELLGLEQSSSNGKKIWILDEAGLVSTKDVAHFLARAKQANARVILSGDPSQYSSIGAGRALSQIIESGAVPVTSVETIVRQRTAPSEVKLAAEQVASGKIADAVKTLADSGRVIAIEDPAQRAKKVAELYTAAPGSKLLITPTNAARNELNMAVRDLLIARGDLDTKTARDVLIHVPLSITQAKRRLASSYSKGNAVRFYRSNRSDIEKNVWYSVVGTDIKQNLVTIKNSVTGEEVTYSPRDTYTIEDVYGVESRSLAEGEHLLRFKTKDKTQGVTTGELAKVVKFISDKEIEIENIDTGKRRVLDIERYRTWDYGYAATGHSSQGVTVDTAILVQTSGHREEVVNSSSAYVGLTRQRKEVILVTDRLGKATHDMQRGYTKDAALDVFEEQVVSKKKLTHGSEQRPTQALSQ